jgi:hypothetical protein
MAELLYSETNEKLFIPEMIKKTLETKPDSISVKEYTKKVHDNYDLLKHKYENIYKRFNKNVKITKKIFLDNIQSDPYFKVIYGEYNNGRKCALPSQYENYEQIAIKGDGNCLFHSLQKGILYWASVDHMHVRYEICSKLPDIIRDLVTVKDPNTGMYLLGLFCHNDAIINYITSDTIDKDSEGFTNEINKYIDKMLEWGEYGSPLEILTAGIITRTNICVYKKNDNRFYEVIKKRLINALPKYGFINEGNCKLILHLCAYDIDDNENHYEILVNKIDDTREQISAEALSDIKIERETKSAIPALAPPAPTALPVPAPPAPPDATVAEPVAVIAEPDTPPTGPDRPKAPIAVAELLAVVAKPDVPLVAAVGSPTKTGAEPPVSAAAGTPTKAESEPQASLIAPQVKVPSHLPGVDTTASNMPIFKPPENDLRYVRNVRLPNILPGQSVLPSKSTQVRQLEPPIKSKPPIALTPTSVQSSNMPKFIPPNDLTHVRSRPEAILPAQSALPSKLTLASQLEPQRMPLTPSSVQSSNTMIFEPPNDMIYTRTIRSTREKYIKSARSVNTYDITYKYKYLKYKKKYLTLKNNNNF